MQASSKRALLEAVEAHMTALVREAVIVQRHAKRSKYSKKASSSSSSPSNSAVWLLPEDINMVLQWRGSEKLYATESASAATLVVLNDFLKQEPSVLPSSEVTMTVHWLAVEGIQPNISMNPAAIISNSNLAHSHLSSSSSSHVTLMMGQQDTSLLPQEDITVQHLLPKLLSEELQLYYHRIITLVRSEQTMDVYTDTHHNNNKMKRVDGYLIALHALHVDKGIQELIPFFIHYFVHTLIHQKGIQSLQPEWAYRGIRGILALLLNPHVHVELHLHQIVPMVFTCLVAKALDPSHVLILSSTPKTVQVQTHTTKATRSATHWEVRRWAALCMYTLCQKYSKEYTTVQPRVLKTLVDAFSNHWVQPPTTSTTSTTTSRPPCCWNPSTLGYGSTVYGALLGLAYFGSRVIDAFILPMACSCWTLWEQQQALSYPEWIESKPQDEHQSIMMTLSQWKDLYFIQTHEIQMCQEALLMNMGIFFRHVSLSEQEKRLDYQQLDSVFGEKLIPLQVDTFFQESHPYWTCFI